MWIAHIIFVLVYHRTFVSSIPTVTMIPTGCGTLGPNAGQIISSGGGFNYTDPVNCSLTMTATSSSHRIRFAFNTGNGDSGVVRNPNSTGGVCSGASVEIFDGPDINSDSIAGKFCGNLASTERLSTGNTLTLRVQSIGGNDTNINFTAHYTSFTEDADCGSDFPCNNGRCISQTMTCDTTLINNCGDFSDNSRDPPANCTVDDVTTSSVETTAEVTTAASSSGSEEPNVAIYAAAAIGGLLGLYFLHWLLFRPGWLVWRMGCVRHLRCCRNCPGGSSSKNSVNAEKPLTSSMNNINSKKSDEMYSDSPASTRSVPTKTTDHTTTYSSSSPFSQGIHREHHIFSVS